MKNKSTSRSAFFSLRALLGLLLCAAASSILTGTSLDVFPARSSSTLSQRTLTFAERVAYQRAIEEVYWRHRIWPKERPDPKPSLDAVMSQAKIEKKVQITCANRKRWRMTGNSRSQPSNCRLKWIAWRSTPNSPRCCANSLKRSATILLSLRSVWPGRCCQSVWYKLLWLRSKIRSAGTAEPTKANVAAASASYTLPTISDAAERMHR